MLLGTFLGGQAEIHGDLVVVDEDMLLRELVDRCRKAGVILIDHCELLNISWSKHWIHVRGSSQSFDSRLLVDCMGDNSPVASTFRPHRIHGFYSIVGAHLSRIKLKSGQIVLSYVSSLGNPALILEIAPTGNDSAYCALYTCSRQLVSVHRLDSAFREYCERNPFFELTATTRVDRGKSGAITIGRPGRRRLPRVVFLGGAALVQPPLLGSGFNEILEASGQTWDKLSLALAHDSTNFFPTTAFYPLLKRAQNRFQLALAGKILQENVEELDWLIRFVATLPPQQAFNLCSNELTWTQLLWLIPRLLWSAAHRRTMPPFIS
jgi:hypothetical protein